MDHASPRAPEAASKPIAVVSRDQAYLDLICQILAEEGYRTLVWTDGKHAYEMICRDRPALVLLDLWLEHRYAGEMVLAMLQLAPDTRNIPVIAATSDVRLFSLVEERLRDTCCEVWLHPFNPYDLLPKIKQLAG